MEAVVIKLAEEMCQKLTAHLPNPHGLDAAVIAEAFYSKLGATFEAMADGCQGAIEDTER